MALPGLRSTADMGTDGRPKDWREGIMQLDQRNGASLFTLTARMKKEVTTDPEFKWWEEEQDILNYQLNGAVLVGATTIVVNERATRLKSGDTLYNERTAEIIRVVSITNDTTFEVTRGWGGTTAAAMNDNDQMIYIGSAYREGAPKALGTSFNPTSEYNYTQIFRDPIEWTRTATKTRLRYTRDIMRRDRMKALNKHSVGIERALWLGARFETLEAGQPIRGTGGLLTTFIPASQKQTVQGGSGLLDADELFSYFPRIFEYGSSEKLAFGGLGVLSIMSELVRKNADYSIMGTEREFGMNITRFKTPAGVLALTEHPLFGRKGQFLANDLVVVDTASLVWRYIEGADTKLLKDRQDSGTDGISEEYLTEGGLEVHNPQTMFWLKGILGAKTDD